MNPTTTEPATDAQPQPFDLGPMTKRPFDPEHARQRAWQGIDTYHRPKGGGA